MGIGATTARMVLYQRVVLANGQFMLANADSEQQALLIARTLTLDPRGAGKADINDEEGWTLLPNLVRITNLATGHVFYSRTHDHSSMAVAHGGLVFTHFDVPVSQELGPSSLVVVANGIPSRPVDITVK